MRSPKSLLGSLAIAGTLLTGCSTVSSSQDSYHAYLDGVPVKSSQNCVDQAAMVAGVLGSASRLRGLWWDCGHVASKDQMGRIARMVAGGAFGVSEFEFAKLAADYAANLPEDGLTTKDRADLRQLASLATVLSAAPPMAHSPDMHYAGAKKVRLPATYDKAGLLRIPIEAKGQSISAVLDTGAAISLMVESQAQRLGLKVHEGSDVASSTRTSVETNWVLVPELMVGDIKFVNVIFLVVPDAAMGLPAGYTIDAILGSPVLQQLQTVCVNDKTVTFAPASADNRPSPEYVDVRFVQSAPMLSILVNDRPITAYLDSGANVSKLSGRFASSFPAEVPSVASKVAKTGGVGGTMETSAATVDNARFGFGPNKVSLDHVDVELASTTDDTEPYATIGQDLLRRAGGWMLDYPNARFEIAARCR